MKVIVVSILTLVLNACGIDGLLDMSALSKDFANLKGTFNADLKGLDFNKDNPFTSVPEDGFGAPGPLGKSHCGELFIPLVKNNQNPEEARLALSPFGKAVYNYLSPNYLATEEKLCLELGEILALGNKGNNELQHTLAKVEFPFLYTPEDEVSLEQGHEVGIKLSLISFNFNKVDGWLKVGTNLNCPIPEPARVSCEEPNVTSKGLKCKEFNISPVAQVCSFSMKNIKIYLGGEERRIGFHGKIEFNGEQTAKLRIHHVSW